MQDSEPTPLNAEDGIDVEDASFLYGDGGINSILDNTIEHDLKNAINTAVETIPNMMRKNMDTLNAHVSLSLRAGNIDPTHDRGQLVRLTRAACQPGQPTISDVDSPPSVTDLAERV